ncbi:hypothetical protein EFA46_013255 (plasmid) [Halarchaeum sp. CBA1220]|uniref:hypothetical protein n=1 Tax=Halarchaeum sp. CBA1220 TaxID=1853682 RepID=UPI000F3A924A|nr:hypothetical protein [Halarchaeum sp. CBA1220]QLC35211.1 hypothetical protein EFA46_013255 [Halarchaeum sp. CBA1220]
MLNSGVYSFSMMVAGCIGLCVGCVIFLNELIGDPMAVVQGIEIISSSTLTIAAIIVGMSFLTMAFGAFVFMIARSKHRRHLRHMR